jgi:hypothetical protein
MERKEWKLTDQSEYKADGSIQVVKKLMIAYYYQYLN